MIDVDSETERRTGHGKSSPDEKGLHFGHRSRRRKSHAERTATHSLGTSGVDLTFATHLVPTFRSSSPVAAPTFHELRKVVGTSKPMTLVPLFDLKFLDQTRHLHCRNFKSAALTTDSQCECQIHSTGNLYLLVVL